jgi:hypothetical protein
LADGELQGGSTSHKLCARGGQPVPLLAFGGSLSLELSDPLLKRSTPGVRISLQGLGKEHQCCQLGTQRPRLFAAISSASHTVAERCKLPAQLFVFHQRRARIVIPTDKQTLAKR